MENDFNYFIVFQKYSSWEYATLTKNLYIYNINIYTH